MKEMRERRVTPRGGALRRAGEQRGQRAWCGAFGGRRAVLQLGKQRNERRLVCPD